MTDPKNENLTPGEQGGTRAPDQAGEDREEVVRRRAYEISQSEHSGTPEENWERAEREIRGG